VLDCPIAESKLRQLIEEPVISIVIPTYQRSDELALAVTSIADQLTGGLEHKVEIIVTDNGSGPDTVARVKHMAAQYPSVSYLLHKRDEGGFFQFFAAPWRARGRYTWVFGSDDLLLPGGLGEIVTMLEREQPSYAGLNKKVFDRDLSQEIWSAANFVPDQRFARFEDLFCALGINQFAFISGNIELTETARAFDARPLLQADTRHPHVVGYLAKHHGRPAYYFSTPYLVHRLDNSTLGEYHAGNIFDYAVTLPGLLHGVLRDIGAPPDFFERMTGDKRLQTFDASGPTFVDSIFENLLRAMGLGRYFTVSQRWALEDMLRGCRPQRLQQLNDIWQMQDQIMVLERQVESAKSVLAQGKQACLQASKAFAQQAG
jgi:glycosyltransferase involved in cell wall biosynthesis